MPVVYNGDYGDVDTWTVVDPGGPFVDGVPGSWSDDAGYSLVTAKPGATVLITGTGGNPLFSYTTDTIEPNALRLLVNAVGAPVPTMNTWGIMILTVLLGVSSALCLRRRLRV